MFRLQPPLPDDYSTAPPTICAAASRGRPARPPPRHPRSPLPARGGHAFADMRGDSFGLSRFAAEQHEAEFVVFCGVHFMAESADILTGPHQQVILPDLNAGCSMADMADLDGVEQTWDELAEVTDIEAVVPITYMNSAAALKAFVGRNVGRGLHLVERPRPCSPGRSARRHGAAPGRQGPFLPRPAPRPQHRASSSATTPPTCRSSTPASASAACRTPR